MTDNIEIRIMKEKDECWEQLLEGFWSFRVNETVSSSIPGLVSGNGKTNLVQVLEGIISEGEGPVVIAWDKGENKLAGFLINDVRYAKGQPAPERVSPTIPDLDFENISKEEMKAFKDFWILTRTSDPCGTYKVDKTFYLLNLMVTETYQGKGIASRLVQRSLEEAIAMGLPLAAGTFTSTYAQKVVAKEGFEVIREFIYEDTYKLYSSIPEKIRDQHPKCICMAKRL